MSSEDEPFDKIIENSAKGIAKGILELTKEEIILYIKKFREKKFAFIGEEKTIEIAKEQYNSGESKFYHEYIKDKKLLYLIGMGLTLRKIEKDEEKRQNLRKKIFNKYRTKGLHISEFVQNGILNRYIGILIEELESIKDLTEQIEEVLNNIEKHIMFVQVTDRLGDVVKKAVNIIHSHTPNVFVISGECSVAGLIRDNIEKIKEALKDYELERISIKERETLFFKRKLI
jgi:hypothetical protein